jgi:hypothetical protein
MAARGSGTVVWMVVFVVALVVGAMAVWVWPSTGTPETEPTQVDTTGPVGRIGPFTAGTGTGATGALQAPDYEGEGAYTGLAGTGAISGPIGGVGAARDGSALATPLAASGGRSVATPTAVRSGR